MRIGNREFAPRLFPTLVTIVILPVLISLGFWQLDRAEQKREILKQYEQQQNGTVLNLNTTSQQEHIAPYQQVEATGRFDAQRQFLLDNKVHQGRAGYQVITPLLLENSKQAILVNRGWLPQTASRQQLPSIPTPSDVLHVRGKLKTNVDKNFHLGESGVQQHSWPQVIQWLDIKQIKKSLGYQVFPYVILQDADNPAGFVRDWYIKKITPEKNTSYAVQWFALALALIIIFLVVNTHKVKEVD